MHRILFTAALLAVAPVGVHAQAVAPKADATSTQAAQEMPRKSHNPFGAAILELTRAAREQAAAAKTPDAAPATTPAARDARKPASAPVPAVPAGAPVLADSHRS